MELVVYDDAVLFRLMTGWAAITSHKSYAKCMTGLSDEEEVLAALSREIIEDSITSKKGACFMRFPLSDGTLVADPLHATSLGKAGYIKLSSVVIERSEEQIHVAHFTTNEK